MDSHKNVTDEETISDYEAPLTTRRLPYETGAEHTKFGFFFSCGPRRSVRRAYLLYCKENGIKPKQNPPSSWYDLFRGEYLAIRRAKQKIEAIERAGEVHGREPNYPLLMKMAAPEATKYPPEFAEIMVDLALIDLAFDALAIDLNGDPLPGIPPWEERRAAYQAAPG